MSLATRINPKKRSFRDNDFERYQYATHPWHEPEEGEIADATTRPDLHEHHFHTRHGRRDVETYKREYEQALDPQGDISIADNDLPELSVIDRTPDRRHVHFTPKSGWYPASPMDLRGEGEMPKPSLRNRLKTHDALPDDYKPDSPFRWDTSEWIEQEELNEQKSAEQQRVEAQQGPLAKISYTQYHVPAAASPSALGLSGLRKFQAPQSTVRSLRQSVLNRNTPQYQQLKNFTPDALDQTDSIPLSVADRPKLTPTRRLASPPRQLTPPKPSSPEASYTQATSPPQASSQEALYPSLSASYYDLSAETSLDAQQSEEPRYVGGMAIVTTFGNYLTGLITNCWNYIRGKPKAQHIIAVGTDNTRRKRRAVAAEDTTYKNTPSPQIGDVEIMPGQFPEPSSVKEPKINITYNQNTTPPDSRPGSSEREDGQKNTRTQSMTTQQPSPPEPSRSRADATERRHSSPEEPQPRRIPGTLGDEEFIPAKPDRPLSYHELATRKYKRPTTIFSPEQRKAEDARVDNLVTKAKKITLETEEEKIFRKSYRTRQQKLEDARLAKEREAQAKKDAEREAEELRKKSAEEEEKRLAKEAEEEAARALKAQFIRPLSQEWVEKIQKAMNGPDMSHVVATTPGTGTEVRRSDFAKLLPQKDSSGQDLRPSSSDGAGKRKTGPSGWLNDEVVNGWNECIVESLNNQAGYKKGPNTAPEIAAFNCAWLTTLKQKNMDMKSISGWARRLGIKGKTQNTKEYKILKTKKIFFPINSGAHWMLMIIDPPNREIQFLDSLAGKSSPYLKLARQWLEMELAEAYIPDEWTESKIASQQQMNYDDCGVFACINALASATGVGFQDFGVTNGMNDARCMMGAVLINGGFTGEWEL